MEVTERILEIIKKSGLTPSEFADKIEVQRSAISHITSGRNKPSLDFLLKVKNSYPEIDTDWLLFGIEKTEDISDKSNENSSNSSSPIYSKNENSNRIISSSNPNKKTENESRDFQNNSERRKIVRVLLFFDDGSFQDYEN